MLLPSLVLSAALLQPVRYLLLLCPASGLLLRRPVIPEHPQSFRSAGHLQIDKARLLIGGR
jgi:hypothetical protein